MVIKESDQILSDELDFLITNKNEHLSKLILFYMKQGCNAGICSYDRLINRFVPVYCRKVKLNETLSLMIKYDYIKKEEYKGVIIYEVVKD